MRFLQRQRNAGHIPDAERDRIAVIRPVLEAQCLGVAFDEADLVLQPAIARPILAHRPASRH